MFETIQGHQTITKHLANEIDSQQVSHAYLFSGIDGIGKKKTARSLPRPFYVRIGRAQAVAIVRFVFRLSMKTIPMSK